MESADEDCAENNLLRPHISVGSTSECTFAVEAFRFSFQVLVLQFAFIIPSHNTSKSVDSLFLTLTTQIVHKFRAPHPLFLFLWSVLLIPFAISLSCCSSSCGGWCHLFWPVPSCPLDSVCSAVFYNVKTFALIYQYMDFNRSQVVQHDPTGCCTNSTPPHFTSHFFLFTPFF